MNAAASSVNPVFRLSDRITLVPVVHGSGDCSVAVRRMMLEHDFHCLAVPLPPSHQTLVEDGVRQLPRISVILQHPTSYRPADWGETEHSDRPPPEAAFPYVPIDPCQPVIAAVRSAIGEHRARVFIDEESETYQPHSMVMPDPFAIKRTSLATFATALLPALKRPRHPQIRSRIRHMARELRRWERSYDSILCLCSIVDWPWLRSAYADVSSEPTAPPDIEPNAIQRYVPFPPTLLFLLGELPFITHLYERYRARLDDDTNLSIDGVKELLLAARKTYRQEFRRRARPISPQSLGTCLQYIRNLTLFDRRLTPDLYNIIVAAKQVVGDGYAAHVAERAREYPEQWMDPAASLFMGIDRARLPDGSIVPIVSRLPGPPVQWRSIQLKRRPQSWQRRRWQMQWNPYAQCSWPPEDDKIEQFRTHVVDRVRALIGADLARTEKFTASIKDGIDIRETLRNWHTRELYVKVLPPARGPLDAVVMLFDSPADPREYPWRTTWFAEHAHESTLAFFATNYQEELVGPGIGLAQYGGALFLFPPRMIADVWRDPRLNFTETLEERLLAAACLYSHSSHVALGGVTAPGRRLATVGQTLWEEVCPPAAPGIQPVADLPVANGACAERPPDSQLCGGVYSQGLDGMLQKAHCSCVRKNHPTSPATVSSRESVNGAPSM